MFGIGGCEPPQPPEALENVEVFEGFLIHQNGRFGKLANYWQTYGVKFGSVNGDVLTVETRRRAQACKWYASTVDRGVVCAEYGGAVRLAVKRRVESGLRGPTPDSVRLLEVVSDQFPAVLTDHAVDLIESEPTECFLSNNARLASFFKIADHQDVLVVQHVRFLRVVKAANH